MVDPPNKVEGCEKIKHEVLSLQTRNTNILLVVKSSCIIDNSIKLYNRATLKHETKIRTLNERPRI